MERTGRRIRAGSLETSRRARRLHAGLLMLASALMLGGCYVVPAQTAYVAPAPVYVAPAPVYVAPAPVYVAPAPVYRWGWGYGYGWRRGRW